MKVLFALLLPIFLLGCLEHRVDTFPKWCEQSAGVDLRKQHAPFWTIIFSVSFDGEAIRDDFTAFLKKTPPGEGAKQSAKNGMEGRHRASLGELVQLSYD